jgi:cytochrome P450
MGRGAGHETTGAALSRVLPEILKQPRIMQRMREEQASVIQRFGNDITCER